MKNLIKYHYEKAKHIGIEVSPTKELMDLGFRGIRIHDMSLPEYIIYESSNQVERLPKYIELISQKMEVTQTA